jgi:hypothetical protein
MYFLNCIIIFYSSGVMRLSALVLWLQVGPLCQPQMIRVGEKLDHWWNYDRGKLKYFKKKTIIVTYMDCPAIEPEPL